MTDAGTRARARGKLFLRGGDGTHEWIDFDRSAIAERYNRLARVIPFFDWLFFQPPGFRAKAVGPTGRVYGADLSPGMLAQARAACDRNSWRNVELIECDAADYRAPVPLDGVMFGLSYNTMPHHLTVLREAWNQLRPGGRLVIMDAKLPPGLGGKLILPFSLWLMKRTMLGNPLIKPWEDLARFTDELTMEQFMFGSWYICCGIKR